MLLCSLLDRGQPIELPGVTPQNTTISTLTATRTSNLTLETDIFSLFHAHQNELNMAMTPPHDFCVIILYTV